MKKKKTLELIEDRKNKIESYDRGVVTLSKDYMKTKQEEKKNYYTIYLLSFIND